MDYEDTRARIVQYNHLPLSAEIIIDQINRARESGEFTDFTLTCDGRDIKVHKIIICSQSPVFRAACAGQFKVWRFDTASTPDCRSDRLLGSILRYI